MAPGDRRVHLTLDAGTSRLKGALVTRGGETVHYEVGSARHPVAQGSGGVLEQLVQEIESLVRRLVDAARSSRLEVAALGLAAHMASVLLLDEDHEPVGNLMLGVDEAPAWAVEKAASEAERVGIDLHQRTGCPLLPQYPLPKLYASAASSASASRARYVGDLKSYLLWRWTGRFVTDFGSASASQLLDHRRREWLQLPGLPWRAPAYPVLCCPWQIAGPVGPTFGAAMGLSMPVPVVVGTGDGVAASIGAGILHSPQALLSVGTTATVRWREHGWTVLGPGQFRQLVSPRVRLVGSRVILLGPGGAPCPADSEARAALQLATMATQARSRPALSGVQIAGGGAGPVWVEAFSRLGLVVGRPVCDDGTFGMAIVMEKALSRASLGEVLRVMRAGRSPSDG